MLNLRLNHIVVALLISVLFNSCIKAQLEPGVPKCMAKIIKSTGCYSCEKSLKEYLFQDEIVYVYYNGITGIIRSSNYVYNTNCELIGTLGGSDNNTIINDEDFSNAIFLRLVWEND